MKPAKTQCHIDSNGEIFLADFAHPYSEKSKISLQRIFNKMLEGSQYKIVRTKNDNNFYIARSGFKFLNILLTVSDSGGVPNRRKVRVPYSSKKFLQRLKSETPNEFVIISPYSTLRQEIDGTYSVDKEVFLIMNECYIYDSHIGQIVGNTLFEKLKTTSFSTSSRWFSVSDIRDSIYENRIIQNNAKNLSCVPANKFLDFLNASWAAYCVRTKDSFTNNSKKGYPTAKETGLQNERNYFAKLTTEPDFLSIASSQYSNNGGHITNIVHTGGKQTLSIYNDKITQKADLELKTDLGEEIRVSLKKEKGAYLHQPTVERFFESMEIIYGITIPENVREMTYLFFHAPETDYYDNILQEYAIHPEEIRKRRLFQDQLLEYNSVKTQEMLDWFTEYQNEIFEFMSIRGNMANENDFITHFAFINTFDLNVDGLPNLNKVIPVSVIQEELRQLNEVVKFNPAGTQLWFPWGSIENKTNFFYTRMLLGRIEKLTGHTYLNGQYNSLITENT